MQKDNSEFFFKTLERIKNSRYILIATNKDTNRSSLALALTLSNYFLANKIKHKIFNPDKELPQNLNFINGFSKITRVIPKFYDLIISFENYDNEVFDFNNFNNLVHINFNYVKNSKKLGIICPSNIDNIKSLLIYDFLNFNKIEITKDIAISLYSAIYLDTKAFTKVDNTIFERVEFLVKKGANASLISQKLVQNDSLAKYRIKAKILDSLELHKEGKIATIYTKKSWFNQTGATLFDVEGFCEEVLNIKIVESAIFIIEQNESIKIEFCSKDEEEKNRLATIFNDEMCINFTKSGDIFEIKNVVLKEIL